MNVADCFIENGIKIKYNTDTSKISSIKAGGCVKYGLYPDNIGNFIKAVKICRLLDIKFKVIGGCTNTFFRDEGYDGAVIFTTGLKHIEICGGYILSECGCSLSKLLKSAADSNLEISNSLFGIPGTVGGALRNNAGALGCEFSESFIEGLFLDTDTFEVICLNNNDLNFAYRHSLLMEKPLIFLRGKLKTKTKMRDVCFEEFEEIASLRRSRHPNFPSLGSFFKRCGDVIPAALIDSAGLKNYRINDAMISDKHAGFIVNLGNASSSDIDNLAKNVETKIKEMYNVELLREAELIE